MLPSLGLPGVNVVIPTIGKDRMIVDLLQQITEQDDDIVDNIYVMDNGMDSQTKKDCLMFPKVKIFNCPKLNIYQMWNLGIKYSLGNKEHNYIAILNDDLILCTVKDFFTQLVEPLDLYENIWGVCGNYDHRASDLICTEVTGTFKDNGFAGFCFAVPGRAYINGLPLFDERYNIWYGDDDLVHYIHKAGKRTVMSIAATMIHIKGGSNSFGDRSKLVNEENQKDTDIYMKKWHTNGN